MGIIRISGFVEFETIYFLEIHTQVNEHGIITIKGLLTETSYQLCQERSAIWQKIQVNQEDGTDSFFGIITELNYYPDRHFRYVEIRGKTESFFMDQTPESHVVQDVEMTYMDVIQYLNYGPCKIYLGNYKNIQLETPFIQYEKTNWAGIKQLAGRLKTIVWVDHTIHPNRIIVGDYDRRFGKNPLLLEDDHILSKEKIFINQRKERYEVIEKGCYEILEFECENTLELGEWVIYMGNKLQIMEKEICFQKGNLEMKYKCSLPNFFRLERPETSELKGTVLEGTVYSTNYEWIQVDFDLDTGSPKKRFEFPYLPESGNVFYSMPEQGTKVCVYFPDDYESHGYVIHGKRERLASYPEPDRKEFCANHKMFCILPDMIQLSGHKKSTRNDLILMDQSGILFQSQGSLHLSAKGSICITTKGNCTIGSREYIKIEQSETNNFVEMSGNDIFYSAKKYVLSSYEMESKKNPMDKNKDDEITFPQVLDYAVGGVRNDLRKSMENALIGGVPVSKTGKDHRNIYAGLGKHLGG